MKFIVLIVLLRWLFAIIWQDTKKEKDPVNLGKQKKAYDPASTRIR